MNVLLLPVERGEVTRGSSTVPGMGWSEMAPVSTRASGCEALTSSEGDMAARYGEEVAMNGCCCAERVAACSAPARRSCSTPSRSHERSVVVSGRVIVQNVLGRERERLCVCVSVPVSNSARGWFGGARQLTGRVLDQVYGVGGVK